MNSDPLNKIKEYAEVLAAQRNMFLVDVEIKQEDMNIVWVLVDAEEGGVNVDECSDMSRELAHRIDEEDLVQGSYRLNVSSPGLSRPLSDQRQYRKNIGRAAKVKYKTGDEYQQTEGTLSDVTDEFLTIKAEDEKSIKIAFSDLAETKIIPKL